MNLELLTTKIPHHSGHSGYEQLIKYLPDAEVFTYPRGHGDNFLKHNFERILRRFTCSKWYQWDSLVFEREVYRKAKKASKEEPLIAHMLYGDTSIGWIPYVKDKLNLKLVLTIHTCPSDMDEVFQRPELLKKVDAFILLGGNQVPWLRKLGIPNRRMHVIPHGVDADFFHPAEKSTESKKVKQILMVGSWRRNFDLYKKVAESTLSDSNLHYNIVTHEHNFPPFRNLSNVTCKTGLGDVELLHEYQNSDALLLGIDDAVANNVLVEAMATKLPVISERVGAISEYVSDEEAHFTEPNDVPGIVEKLELIKSGDSSVKEKAEKAYQRVHETLAWPMIAERTMSVYRGLK
jgi:glycosyltransferase involved in cell wall biosynthesis